MRITPEIITAIKLASRQAGSNTALGAKCGLHGATLGQYVGGRIRIIKDDAWDRLEPVLRPYLRTSQDGVKSFPAGESHPCDGRPPELADLCAAWDQIPEGEKAMVLAVVTTALKKQSPGQSAAPARKLRAG